MRISHEAVYGQGSRQVKSVLHRQINHRTGLSVFGQTGESLDAVECRWAMNWAGMPVTRWPCQKDRSISGQAG